MEETVAIFVFDEVNVTFSLIPYVFGFNVTFLPLANFKVDLTPVIPGTVTVQVTFFLPDFTVIFAVPGAFAAILPLLLTVATFLFELL